MDQTQKPQPEYLLSCLAEHWHSFDEVIVIQKYFPGRKTTYFVTVPDPTDLFDNYTVAYFRVRRRKTSVQLSGMYVGECGLQMDIDTPGLFY